MRLNLLEQLETGQVLIDFIIMQNKNKNANDAIMKQMELYFENTANKIFETSSEKLTNTNKEKLEDFFSKFKEKIEDFEKRTNEKFKNEDENFIKFDQNIKQFIEAGSKISQDTT